MQNIERELEKLLCYTMNRPVIRTEDVEAVCTEQTENRIFDMVQAITEQNQRKALDLYSDLLAHEGTAHANLISYYQTVSPAAAVKRTGSGRTGPGGDSKESRHSALCSWKIPGAGKKIYQSAASSGSRRLCEYGRTGEDRTDR